MAAGCTFGSRCQYSHDTTWLRRNPLRCSYEARRCPDQLRGQTSNGEDGSGASGDCRRGIECNFAHSLEEELYHPRRYKTSLCEDGDSCTNYYCPFTHRNSEMRACDVVTPHSRRRPRAATGGHVLVGSPSRDSAAATGVNRNGNDAGIPPPPPPPPPPMLPLSSCVAGKGEATSDVSTGVRWWQFGEQLRVAVAADGVGSVRACRPTVPNEEDAPFAGAALAGGHLSPGRIKLVGSDVETECAVKLVLTDRRLHVEAKRVVKETRRWKGLGLRRGGGVGACSAVGGASGTSPAGVSDVTTPTTASSGGVDTDGGAATTEACVRMYELKRTVAAIGLAMPVHPSTLDRSALAALGQGGIAARVAGGDLVSALAGAKWVRQLAAEVRQLHVASLTHTCISPRNVFVTVDGCLQLGDFLGKIRTLNCLAHGPEGGVLDESWAMWYPPELHECVAGFLGDAFSRNSTIASTTDASPARGDATVASVDFFKVDAWQLGVVIFVLLTLQHPFGDSRDPASVCKNIMEDQPVNLALLNGLPLFKDLVGKMLVRATDSRVVPADIMHHPAFWTLEDASAAHRLSNDALPLTLWRLVPSIAFLCSKSSSLDTERPQDNAADIAPLLRLSEVIRTPNDFLQKRTQHHSSPVHKDASPDGRLIHMDEARGEQSGITSLPTGVGESTAEPSMAFSGRASAARLPLGGSQAEASFLVTEQLAKVASVGVRSMEPRRQRARTTGNCADNVSHVSPPPGLELPTPVRDESLCRVSEKDMLFASQKERVADAAAVSLAPVASATSASPCDAAESPWLSPVEFRGACRLLFDDLGEGSSVCYVRVASPIGEVQIGTISPSSSRSTSRRQCGDGVLLRRRRRQLS
eukprot:TRINITY_DN20629_c0_g1_i4.p1 TRINITY_DN20629_c0_g1~~TRINITY_DN20629_c0_g1_i4.p1  ORF type:complete len:913 (-),score=126.33 TRINITY_DN20629_c0_g1_i4:72-2675(-)